MGGEERRGDKTTSGRERAKKSQVIIIIIIIIIHPFADGRGEEAEKKRRREEEEGSRPYVFWDRKGTFVLVTGNGDGESFCPGFSRGICKQRSWRKLRIWTQARSKGNSSWHSEWRARVSESSAQTSTETRRPLSLHSLSPLLSIDGIISL